MGSDTKLGEKIETIILARESGALGDYLGASGETFGACRIDGVVYKVKRNSEVDGPFWEVRNLNNHTTTVVEDCFDLPMITEADFK